MDRIQDGSESEGDKLGSTYNKLCLEIEIIGKAGSLLLAACLLLFFVLLSGCGDKFFDPTQVGRFRPVPAVNVILDSLGVAEETPIAWEHAEEPRPIDTIAVESDYVFRAGDVISVAIFELLQEGIQFVNNYVVTETGRISIPEVGVIEVAGLTETQLEEEIKKILSPGILKNPSIIVTLSGSQQRAFSILGDGVPLPGRYPIPRYNFRLTDALATAGGPRQFNVSYIYVSRFDEGNRETGYENIKPGFDGLELKVIDPESTIPLRGMQQTESPEAKNKYQWPQSKVVISSSEMATDDDWEAAGMPTAFGNNNPDQLNSQTQWQSSEQEPIGVNDILRTLEERSLREKIWLSGQVDVENAMDSFRFLARSQNSATQRVNRRDSRAFTPAPVAPDVKDEPVSVRDILKTLQERSRKRQKRLNSEVDVDNAQQSFEELARPNEWSNQRINRSQALASSVPVAPQVINEQLVSKESGRIEWKFEDGKWIPVQSESQAPPPQLSTPATTPTPTQEKEQPGHVEWVFRNGKWVPVQVGKPTSPETTKPVKPIIKIEPEEASVTPYEMMSVKRETGTRLIKIPAEKLLAGDSRYNIVIKPGDTIHVPVDIVGEFCIMGHVNRPGYFNMTGRPMTLKMAIAAAGGLGPLAWPKRVEVVRRIGRKHEEIVMLDLDKIASGEQPDIFIKPNDLINVGTHPTSRWRAILRNAFRATYGFGFVYDRNFADRDFGTHRPFPGWF